jgi:hypothetical protein
VRLQTHSRLLPVSHSDLSVHSNRDGSFGDYPMTLPDDLSAIVASGRAFPAAVAELRRSHTQPLEPRHAFNLRPTASAV